MQEVLHLCDMAVGKSGNVCGERVPEDAPTSFSVDGVPYEIDLCEKHRETMLKSLDPFVAAARKPSMKNVATTKSKSNVRAVLHGRAGAFTTKDVRAWLSEQGREVSPTGRLPQALIEEFKEAHA